MTTIFISHRKRDKVSEELHTALIPCLPRCLQSEVFICNRIKDGQIWEQELLPRVKECSIFISAVTQNWQGYTDGEEQRDITRTDDYIHKETKTALLRRTEHEKSLSGAMVFYPLQVEEQVSFSAEFKESEFAFVIDEIQHAKWFRPSIQSHSQFAFAAEYHIRRMVDLLMDGYARTNLGPLTEKSSVLVTYDYALEDQNLIGLLNTQLREIKIMLLRSDEQAFGELIQQSEILGKIGLDQSRLVGRIDQQFQQCLIWPGENKKAYRWNEIGTSDHGRLTSYILHPILLAASVTTFGTVKIMLPPGVDRIKGLGSAQGNRQIDEYIRLSTDPDKSCYSIDTEVYKWCRKFEYRLSPLWYRAGQNDDFIELLASFQRGMEKTEKPLHYVMLSVENHSANNATQKGVKEIFKDKNTPFGEYDLTMQNAKILTHQDVQSDEKIYQFILEKIITTNDNMQSTIQQLQQVLKKQLSSSTRKIIFLPVEISGKNNHILRLVAVTQDLIKRIEHRGKDKKILFCIFVWPKFNRKRFDINELIELLQQASRNSSRLHGRVINKITSTLKSLIKDKAPRIAADSIPLLHYKINDVAFNNWMDELYRADLLQSEDQIESAVEIFEQYAREKFNTDFVRYPDLKAAITYIETKLTSN